MKRISSKNATKTKHVTKKDPPSIFQLSSSTHNRLHQVSIARSKEDAFFSGNLNMNGLHAKANQPEKLSLFMLFVQLIRRLFSWGGRNQILSNNMINNRYKENVLVNNRLVAFMLLLMKVLKSVRKFRFRTQYRVILGEEEKKLRIIGDLAYENKENEDNLPSKRTFIKSKRLRKVIRKLKDIYKKYLKHGIKKFDTNLKAFHKMTLSRYIPVILPDRKIKLIWDILIIFIITFYFYVIPMQLSFDIFYDDEIEEYLFSLHVNHKVAQFLVVIPEMFLITDTILKFITGFYEDGVVVTDKGEIMMHYLKKGLLFDILSYFPVIIQGLLRKSLPSFFAGHDYNIRFLQLMLFFKLKRVKIAIGNFEEIISSKGGHDYLLTAFRLFYVILFLTHMNACVWHATAFFHPNQEQVKTWLTSSGMVEEYWLLRYLHSLYWSISMFSTIGTDQNMYPQNNLEILVASVLILISVLIFAYSMNSMKQILDMMGKEEKEYKETVRVINGFMKRNDINFETQSKVRRYLEFTMNNESDSNEKDTILNKLTKSLRKEVLLEAHGKLIMDSPFFKRFSQEFQEKMALSLKELRFSPEEFIYHEGEKDDNSMYILCQGQVEEIKKNGSRHAGLGTTLRTLKKGEIFGWFPFFSNESRVSSLVSKSFSTVYEIRKGDFLQMLEKHPQDLQKYHMIKDQMKVYQVFKGFKPCIFCSEENHFLTKCPHLNFVPDRNFIIKRFNYSENSSRKKICRRLKRSPNTLRNFMQINLAALKRDTSKEKSHRSEEEISLNNNIFPPQQLLSVGEKPKFQRTRGSKIREASNLLGAVRMNQDDNLLLESPSEISDEEKVEEEGEIIPMRKTEIKVTKIENNARENSFILGHLQNKEADKNLFDYGIDVMMFYEYYFPENNWTNVLRRLWKNDALMRKRSFPNKKKL